MLTQECRPIVSSFALRRLGCTELRVRQQLLNRMADLGVRRNDLPRIRFLQGLEYCHGGQREGSNTRPWRVIARELGRAPSRLQPAELASELDKVYTEQVLKRPKAPKKQSLRS